MGRLVALFGIAIMAGIGFVILAFEIRSGAIDRMDVSIELAIHRLDVAPLDVVMMVATAIGSNAVLLPAVVVVALWARRHGRRDAAVILATNTIAVLVLVFVIKLIFARERPRLFDKIALPTDYSFPSGHAMEAVAIYGAIAAVLIAIYPHARRPLVAGTIALVALIGMSRIYLGVHWPSDVVGGLLGGIPPLVATVHLLHRGLRVSGGAASASRGPTDS